MAAPSVAWLLVAWLLSLLISQNAELDFTSLSCHQANVQQFYDSVAFLFGGSVIMDLFVSNQQMSRHIQQKCGISRSDSLLELGYGDGTLARLLMENDSVLRYDGLELSEAMLNLTARRTLDDRWRQIHLYQDDSPLDFLSMSAVLTTYSEIFALFVLDALSENDISEVLALLRQRSRSGGRLCLTVLADEADRWSVRVYKAAWRIMPELFGGRRPVRLKSLIDEELWHVDVDLLEDGGWLPFRLLVLEAHGPDWQEENISTADTLRRWASHMKEDSGVPADGESLRHRVAASAAQLPSGVAKDVVQLWLPKISRGSLTFLIERSLQDMNKEDILADFDASLNATSGVQLMQEMRSLIKSWDAVSLEQWVNPPDEGYTEEELRERLQTELDAAVSEAGQDASALASLIRYREELDALQTHSELSQFKEKLYKEVFIPPKDLSRVELEQMVLQTIDRMSPEELRSHLFYSQEDHSLEELRQGILEQMADMSREELEARTLGMLQFLSTGSLQAAVQEVAEQLLTDSEIAAIAAPDQHQVLTQVARHEEL